MIWVTKYFTINIERGDIICGVKWKGIKNYRADGKRRKFR